MPLLPGKTGKEYVLEFKSSNFNEDPRPAIYISEIAAENLRSELDDGNKKFINRFNDVGDFIESISKSEIKGIRRLGEEDIKVRDDKTIRYMICEFGTRHKHSKKEGFEHCNCAKRFSNISGITFERLCREKYEIEYSTEITPEMQDEMESICRNYKGNFPKLETTDEEKDVVNAGRELI